MSHVKKALLCTISSALALGVAAAADSGTVVTFRDGGSAVQSVTESKGESNRSLPVTLGAGPVATFKADAAGGEVKSRDAAGSLPSVVGEGPSAVYAPDAAPERSAPKAVESSGPKGVTQH